MTDDTQILMHEGRAVPFVVEGEGPVPLVLIAEPGLERALGVVAHYLVEEAGFHVVRIGSSAEATRRDERVAEAVAVMEHVGIEHTWIGGHGAGGTVARAFAAEHPERVNGLLLLGVENEDIPLAPVIPVLIIQGADDEVTPPDSGVQLQATAPERVNLRTVDGADHLFPLSHAVPTAIAIEEYLDWD